MCHKGKHGIIINKFQLLNGNYLLSENIDESVSQNWLQLMLVIGQITTKKVYMKLYLGQMRVIAHSA